MISIRGIWESPEINAFCTGPSKNSSLVAVSTGLLGRMDHDEVEGVLGHELSHATNGDMVTMTLIQGVVNTFVFIASVLITNFSNEMLALYHNEGNGLFVDEAPRSEVGG